MEKGASRIKAAFHRMKIRDKGVWEFKTWRLSTTAFMEAPYFGVHSALLFHTSVFIRPLLKTASKSKQKETRRREKKKLGLLGRWLWWHSGEPNTNQSTQIQEERQIKRVGREMHPFFCIPSPEEHSCILLLCYWHSTHCFRSPWPDCIRAKKKWPLEENDCNFPGTTFVGRCKMVGNEVSRIDSWIIMVS